MPDVRPGPNVTSWGQGEDLQLTGTQVELAQAIVQRDSLIDTSSDDPAAARLSGPALRQQRSRSESYLRRYLAADVQVKLLQERVDRLTARRAEATRKRFTRVDLLNVTHVRDRFGWHEVVRVNPTTVSVRTAWSWTDRIPHARVLAVRTNVLPVEPEPKPQG